MGRIRHGQRCQSAGHLTIGPDGGIGRHAALRSLCLGVGVRVSFRAPRYGRIAQLVEQRIENPCVTGSTPVMATI